MNQPNHLAIAGLLAVCAVSVHAQDISFGIIATDSASTQRDRWEPFFRDMEKKTGLTVKSFYAPDYAGVIEAMRFNKIQVAWYGNKSAMEAVDRANGEVFAQVMYADGSFGYNGLLITHKDSPYKTLDDVFKNAKAINFGIGDPNSTSGFLVPSFYLFAQNKIDPRSAFKTMRNASHGANLQAVLARQVDVATNNTEDVTKLEASKPELASQLRVLWRSPLIPSDPFVWRKDLDPAVKAKIKQFVVGYAKTDPEEKAILKNIYNYGGFRESSNAQLLPIRQLELARERMKLEGDERMDAEAKTKALAEIDARLAALKSWMAMSSTAALDQLQARAAAQRPGWGRYLGWAAVLAVLAWAWQGAEIRPLDLVRDAGNIGTYASDFFPPDFRDWRIYVREMVVTVHIAIWGTLLALVAAVPMGLLCASNITPAWVHQPVRRLMDACRAINEMVFAMLFIVAVGLGPFAGVLALAVHTTGTLAKLFSEAVEAIDPRPVEGIRATGAHKLVELLYGVLPQVMPLWLSFTLYRFESNVRSASVVGMVGAGGIGVVLFEVIRGFQYGQTCAVLIILVVTVSVIDLASAFLRKRFI